MIEVSPSVHREFITNENGFDWAIFVGERSVQWQGANRDAICIEIMEYTNNTRLTVCYPYICAKLLKRPTFSNIVIDSSDFGLPSDFIFADSINGAMATQPNINAKWLKLQKD